MTSGGRRVRRTVAVNGSRGWQPAVDSRASSQGDQFSEHVASLTGLERGSCIARSSDYQHDRTRVNAADECVFLAALVPIPP